MFNERDFNYGCRFCEMKFLNDNTTKLKVFYVPATSSASSKAFFTADIYSTNATNKAGSACH